MRNLMLRWVFCSFQCTLGLSKQSIGLIHAQYITAVTGAHNLIQVLYWEQSNTGPALLAFDHNCPSSSAAAAEDLLSLTSC